MNLTRIHKRIGLCLTTLQESLEFPKSWSRCTQHIHDLITSFQKCNKFGKACEIFNAEFSALHNLPSEVLLEILKCLDAADKLSLRLTCRRYRGLFSTTLKDPTISKEAKREVRYRLRKDSHPAKAAAELKAITTLKNLLCSHCLASHPRSCFLDRTLTTSPHTRTCIGLTSVFRFSAHQFYTRAELITRLQNIPESPLYNFIYRCRTLPSPYFVRWGLGTDVLTALYLCDTHSDPTRTVKRSTLKTLLHDVNHQVCPHVHTRDKAFQKRLFHQARRIHLSHNDRSMAPNHRVIPGSRSYFVLAEPNQLVTLLMRCKEYNCETKVVVFREPVFLLSVSVQVYRWLGPLEDVADPRWYVQLESE